MYQPYNPSNPEQQQQQRGPSPVQRKSPQPQYQQAPQNQQPQDFQQFPFQQQQYSPQYNQQYPPQQYIPPQQQSYQQQQPFQNNQQQPYQNNQQQPGLQQNQQAFPNYFNDLQSSATGQIGMQLGSQAFSQAQQNINKNFGRYFDLIQWRYYFDVSNSYVLNKIRLLLFPFFNKFWVRTVQQSEDQSIGHAPPRSDLNAPDLYIPVMSFVTYVIMVGVAKGLDSTKVDEKIDFSPEILGVTASTASFIIMFEVIFAKLGIYFLSIHSDAPILELIAFMGYKFIPINCVWAAKYVTDGWIPTGIFVYTMLSYGFFTLRTLRGLVIPEVGSSPVNEVGGGARKRRVLFLFIIVGLQTLTSWLL
ncbi:YIF1-domain-containing protein, partial [Globomyces pollinis-pini]